MTRVMLAIAVALLLAPDATAQQRIFRTDAAPPPNVLSRTATDFFLAQASTYEPKPDPGLWFPQPVVWPVWGWEPQPPERTVRIIIEYAPPPPAPAPPAPAVAPPPAAAAPPPPPGHKRTLYVIPGCYAGDKLPRRDQLRAGCDLKNLRTISPVL